MSKIPDAREKLAGQENLKKKFKLFKDMIEVCDIWWDLDGERVEKVAEKISLERWIGVSSVKVS